MRPGQPYPATFRTTHSFTQVDPPGVEPGFPACHAGVLPLDDGPVFHSEVRPGIEPDLPRYQGGVLPKHLQTNVTSVIPVGVEPSSPACRAGVLPFDDGIVSVAEVGVEPTKSPASRAGRFSCLRTRP